MAFRPSAASYDVMIQSSIAVTANVNGQTIEGDTTTATFAVSLPDAAVDGANFTINWKAGANALTIATVTGASYKLVDDTGALVTSMVVGTLGESVSFRFSRATVSTGSFVRV